MKKILLTSTCALGLVSVVFAQGNVNWSSIPFNAMTAQTNSTVYSPLYGGGTTGGGSIGATATAAQGFYYQLLYTTYTGSAITPPSSLAALSAWSDAGLTANNATSSAGRLINVNPNAGAQVPWSPGTTENIMLVGWSANLGTTWSSVLATLNSPSALGGIFGNAYFGMSNTGYTTTASTSTSPGAAVFGTAATLQGLPINSLNTQLYLVPVPEPGTMALAALGGASLLLFRRRK